MRGRQCGVVCVEPLPHLVASEFRVCAEWAVPRQGNVEQELFVLCVLLLLFLSCHVEYKAVVEFVCSLVVFRIYCEFCFN